MRGGGVHPHLHCVDRPGAPLHFYIPVLQSPPRFGLAFRLGVPILPYLPVLSRVLVQRHRPELLEPRVDRLALLVLRHLIVIGEEPELVQGEFLLALDERLLVEEAGGLLLGPEPAERRRNLVLVEARLLDLGLEVAFEVAQHVDTSVHCFDKLLDF